MKQLKLMIPGPIDVDDEIMCRMSSAQVPHYSVEAVDCYHQCISDLRLILGCRHQQDIFIINGSGNVAIDAGIGSIVARGSKVIVGVNGFFSDKMALIARSYGAKVVEVKTEPHQPISAKLIEKAIQENRDIKAICVVHLETSTGVLNPILEIGAVAQQYEIPLVVDAISSAGVDPIDMEAWNISICGTSSQKGLESPPGLGIAAVSDTGWKFIEQAQPNDHGWYSNLLYWRDKASTQYAGEATVHPCLVTMAVNNVKALQASLSKIVHEGMDVRIQRHESIAQTVRLGLENMGFDLFPQKGYRSNAVTVAKNSLNIDVNELIEFLKDNYSIEISNGIGEMNNKLFRIGHIGPNASLDCVVPVLVGLEHYLREKGLGVPLGSSLSGIRNKEKKEG